MFARKPIREIFSRGPLCGRRQWPGPLPRSAMNSNRLTEHLAGGEEMWDKISLRNGQRSRFVAMQWALRVRC
jgi:hypothetical protein